MHIVKYSIQVALRTDSVLAQSGFSSSNFPGISIIKGSNGRFSGITRQTLLLSGN